MKFIWQQFPVSSALHIVFTILSVFLQQKKWRLSSVNRDYSVCPSYPPAVIVPNSIDDDILKKAAKFRQGGRFPVLCYYHRKNGMVRCNLYCVVYAGNRPLLIGQLLFRWSCVAVNHWQEPIGSAARKMNSSSRLWLKDLTKVTLLTPVLVSRFNRPEWQVEGLSPNRAITAGRGFIDRWKGAFLRAILEIDTVYKSFIQIFFHWTNFSFFYICAKG